MEENEKENELEKNDNSNENQQLQKNNQSNKSTLIIIVLLVIIAGLLVFIGYDKVFKSDSESNNKVDDKQQEENKDNKDDDNQKEEKPKDGIYSLPDGEISKNNEDLIKYHNLFKANDLIEKSKLDRLSKGIIETLSQDNVNSNKIGYVITKIKPIKKSCSLINLNLDDDFFCGQGTSEMLVAQSKKDKEKLKMLESKNETDTFTKDEVDIKAKELFGKVLDVPKDNVVGYSESSVYVYDSGNNLFAMHTFPGGGTDADVYEESIISANKNGDLLTIESRQIILDTGSLAPDKGLKINKIILTLKWNEEVGRYVFYSRESIAQK